VKRWVLDTSVGVKWLSATGEADFEQALQLRHDFRDGVVELLVPEFFFIEMGNALRYNSKFTVHDVTSALQSLWAMEFHRVDLSSALLAKATQLAYQCQITLYDATFVALAEAYAAPLITADYALCQKTRDLPHVTALKHLSVK